MHIVVFGARGLMGRHLRRQLLARGHRLTSVSRRPDLPALSKCDTVTTWEQLSRRGLPTCDALFALMGEPIADKRWTAPYKRALASSRIGSLERIAALIKAQARPPRWALAASAVGIYPCDGSECDEATPLEGTSTTFLEGLCRDWETAAMGLEPLCPTARLRLGTILAADGGIVRRLAPWFRRGLGARCGTGTQPLPWIHVSDAVGIAIRSLELQLRGPINAVATELVDQATFASALAHALGARVHLAIPALFLRLALGELSSLILEGPRVASKRLGELGYHLALPHLREALLASIAPQTPSTGVNDAD